MLGPAKCCLGIALAVLPWGPGPIGPFRSPEEMAKDRQEWISKRVKQSDVVIQSHVTTIRPDSSVVSELGDWTEVLLGTRFGIAPMARVVVNLRDPRALKGIYLPSSVGYIPPVPEAFSYISDVAVPDPIEEGREYVMFCHKQGPILDVTDYLSVGDDPQMPADVSACVATGARRAPRRRTTRCSRPARLSRRVLERRTRRASRRSSERGRPTVRSTRRTPASRRLLKERKRFAAGRARVTASVRRTRSGTGRYRDSFSRWTSNSLARYGTSRRWQPRAKSGSFAAFVGGTGPVAGASERVWRELGYLTERSIRWKFIGLRRMVLESGRSRSSSRRWIRK
jgi:hypothetical protein